MTQENVFFCVHVYDWGLLMRMAAGTQKLLFIIFCIMPLLLRDSHPAWVITITDERCTLFLQLPSCRCSGAVEINDISQERRRAFTCNFHPWPASLLLLNYSAALVRVSFRGAIDIYSAGWIRHAEITLMTLNCLLLKGMRGLVRSHHWKTVPSVGHASQSSIVASIPSCSHLLSLCFLLTDLSFFSLHSRRWTRTTSCQTKEQTSSLRRSNRRTSTPPPTTPQPWVNMTTGPTRPLHPAEPITTAETPFCSTMATVTGEKCHAEAFFFPKPLLRASPLLSQHLMSGGALLEHSWLLTHGVCKHVI